MRQGVQFVEVLRKWQVAFQVAKIQTQIDDREKETREEEF